MLFYLEVKYLSQEENKSDKKVEIELKSDPVSVSKQTDLFEYIVLYSVMKKNGLKPTLTQVTDGIIGDQNKNKISKIREAINSKGQVRKSNLRQSLKKILKTIYEKDIEDKGIFIMDGVKKRQVSPRDLLADKTNT